jgi:2-dehydropantoate 2-reductase
VGGMIARAGKPVRILCRQAQRQVFLEKGLRVDGPQGEFQVPARAEADSQGEGFVATTDPAEAVSGADLIFVCVKSQDTETLAQTIAPHVSPSATVILMQNGVRNKDRVEKYLEGPTLLESVVLFNALYLEEGKVTLTATESVILDSDYQDHPGAQACAELLRDAGILTRFHKNVRGILWTKLIINLNNGFSALTGGSLFEGLRDPDVRYVGRALMAEGMAVMKEAEIDLEPIPKVDPARLMYLLRAPGWLAALVMKIMIKPYQDVQSSTWQSRVRGRSTEIDYLSGEIVRLAKEHGTSAPLNEKILQMVHEHSDDKKTYTPKELRKLLGI